MEDTLIPANITARQDGQHRGLGLTHTHKQRHRAAKRLCVSYDSIALCDFVSVSLHFKDLLYMCEEFFVAY